MGNTLEAASAHLLAKLTLAHAELQAGLGDSEFLAVRVYLDDAKLFAASIC
jgi:hypothetical protein